MNDENGIMQLPDADRIQGVRLLPGASPALTSIALQYSNARTGWCEVKMPLLDALYLLNLLEAMAVDHGYDHLRHPPGS